MRFAKTRIRKIYQPLSVSVSVEVTSAGSSSLAQTYDEFSGEYIPDRSVSPLVLTPVVNAVASDGTWADGIANRYLADMKWYYSLGSGTSRFDATMQGFGVMTQAASDINGRLTVQNNMAAGTYMRLWFEAVLPDTRTGQNIAVRSRDVILTCDAAVQERLTLAVADRNQLYYPLQDELYMYEWCLAHRGLAGTSAAQTRAMSNPDSYLRKVAVDIRYGDSVLSSGDRYNACSLKVQERSGGSYVDVATGGKVVSADRTGVTFDLRMTGDWTCDIVLLLNGTEADRVHLSFRRSLPAFVVRPVNLSSVREGELRYDKALVTTRAGRMEYQPADGSAPIDCAEAFVDMIWYTSTLYESDRRHTNGQLGVLDLTNVRLGQGDNGWCDVSIEAEYHGVMDTATDGGDTLTDEDGEPYII